MFPQKNPANQGLISKNFVGVWFTEENDGYEYTLFYPHHATCHVLHVHLGELCGNSIVVLIGDWA